VENILLHRPGRPLDERDAGVFASALCCEPIWQTATLHGRSSFVVKFPVSYPSDTATLRIDGAAGWAGLTCLHEVAASGTSAWPDAGHGVISEQPPWPDLAPAGLAPSWFASLALPHTWDKDPVLFHLAMAAHGDAAVVVLATAPRWSAVAATLAPGQWSNPIVVAAPGRRGRCQAAVRFKLLSLTRDPRGLRLFNTPLHELAGHSAPDDRWQCHLRVAGPIEEQTDPTPLFSGAIDMATHVERCRLNTDWLIRVSRSILETERWDLFLVQTHIVDWAHHVLHGALDARHPLHDPARVDEADALLRLFYAMTDELVGAVVAAAGPEANIVVMGDHGQDLHHTTVRFNEWLAESGYLAFAGDGPTIDWTCTRACVFSNSLYINRRDREPHGIVPQHEHDALAAELCAKLLGVTDPRTGDRIVKIAGPREHFDYLGGAGVGMGDIVFCLASGYQARNDRGPLFQITTPWKEFTSGHDHFWPLDPQLHSRLYAAGPAFAAARGLAKLRPIIDVAPTLSAVLGIARPLGSEGHVIDGILTADWNAAASPPTVEVEA
jgi:hypothetical protein